MLPSTTSQRFLIDTNVWLAACANNPQADGQYNSKFDISQQQGLHNRHQQGREPANIRFVRSQILHCLRAGPIIVPAETVTEMEKAEQHLDKDFSPFNRTTLHQLIDSLKPIRQPRTHFTPTEFGEQSAVINEIAIAGASRDSKRPYLVNLADKLSPSVMSLPGKNRERLKPLTDYEKITLEEAEIHRERLAQLAQQNRSGKLGKEHETYHRLAALESEANEIRQSREPLLWQDWVLLKIAHRQNAQIVSLDQDLSNLNEHYCQERGQRAVVISLSHAGHTAEQIGWHAFIQKIQGAAQRRPENKSKELHPLPETPSWQR